MQKANLQQEQLKCENTSWSLTQVTLMDDNLLAKRWNDQAQSQDLGMPYLLCEVWICGVNSG